MYFDSHAHYYDERFLRECAEGVPALLDSLFAADVSAIVNVGTNPENSRLALHMAHQYPKMYAAVGIHPTDSQEIPDLDAAVEEIKNLLADEKAVAIGEIGLDYHYEDTNKEKQAEALCLQMQLAVETGYPVVIHDREAHGDILSVCRQFPTVTGVFHSYSGSGEMVKELCQLGYYISFSGTVTFKNARKVVEAAKEVPPDRLLIETDSPYLAPHPLRGSLNHSGNLVYTNRALAEAIGKTPEETAALTEANARRFFRIK